MTEHTMKAFDADLQGLARMIAEMGGMAEKQVVDAIGALSKQDSTLAQRVIADDLKVDALQHQIEEVVILMLARRQPMAIDLREIISALRISNDLERIGDLAKNIAKRVLALAGGFQLPNVMRGIERMTDLVLAQLKDVLDSYARRDTAKAIAVWRNDEQIDAFNNSLFRELLTYMLEQPRNIGVCIHLVFCAKNIERMGDHATNIAETVHYMIEGRQLADERPKGDVTSETRIPSSPERRNA
jgi:phosphate transport system protein